MSENNGHTKLSSKCIEQLQKNGCFAQKWQDVLFRNEPDPALIRNVRFTGKVKIGSLNKSKKNKLSAPGLFNTHIHNSTIADDVTIENVGLISNCDIGPHVVIRNCKTINMTGSGSFGVGVKAAVINEAGGREVPFFQNLSPQMAYLFAICRHRSVLIEKLGNMVKALVKDSQSDRCRIEQNASVANTGSITNVNIGPFAVVKGSFALENGSVLSSQKSPAFVGTGVIARDFIIEKGASIYDNAEIEKCYIGIGAQVAKGFSAENCLFFYRSQMFRGEACSVFAGPFTVSHHKSSLLIACMLSYYNAGSAANQSNHMYKLGPVHQAVLERGCKSASGSHLVWPARIAPFTTILGKHAAKIDTSDFPFSYLMEQESRSLLLPAAALKSIGTFRDVNKWQERQDIKKLRITQGLFNPYLAQNIEEAIKTLKNLQKTPAAHSVYNNTLIPHSVIPSAVKRYRSYLDCCICEPVINILKNRSVTETLQKIKDQSVQKNELDKWADLAGLIMPVKALNGLIEKIESDQLNAIESIEKSFDKIQRSLPGFYLQWSLHKLQTKLAKPVSQFDKNDLKTIVNHWITAKEKLYQLNMQDCNKEFAPEVTISFGIGADKEQIKRDFLAVRGTFENCAVVKQLNAQFQADKTASERIIEKLT